MSSGTISTRPDYFVGQTINLSLKPCSNPFSNETIINFTKAYEKQHCEQNSDSSNGNSGRYDIVTSLVQDQNEKIKALGVSGNLEFSYGPISGDSNVQFAKNNIDSLLNLSMIIRATQTGRIIKNGLSDFVILKLRNTILKEKHNKLLTFEQFTKKYGTYLIIGFEYGGQILFEANYSTKSIADKMSVAGGLSLSFGKMGFNVKGSVNGNYTTKDINKSTNITFAQSIFPSFNSQLINGPNGIISLLNKICTNSTKMDIDEEKHIDNFMNIRSDLDSKMQRLLSGIKLDTINAIILPMKNISCIMDLFSNEINQIISIQNFFKFTNPLYFKLKELKKGLESINEIYDKHKTKIKKPFNIINEWSRALNKAIIMMDNVENEDELHIYAKKHYDFIIKDEEKIQIVKEMHKRFYKMDAMVLQNQFNSDILNKFNKDMENTIQCDICGAKLILCLVKNCYNNSSNTVRCNHCGTCYYGNSKIYHCINNCNFDKCIQCKPTCPSKHGLDRFITHHNKFSCNKCNIKVDKNVILFGCRKCDYDLCPLDYGIKTEDKNCAKCGKRLKLCVAQNCYKNGVKCDICSTVYTRNAKIFHCNDCKFDKCVLCKETCPGKHGLQRFNTPKDGYSCNKCHKKKMKNAVLFGCRTCNFDLCNFCVLLKY